MTAVNYPILDLKSSDGVFRAACVIDKQKALERFCFIMGDYRDIFHYMNSIPFGYFSSLGLLLKYHKSFSIRATRFQKRCAR